MQAGAIRLCLYPGLAAHKAALAWTSPCKYMSCAAPLQDGHTASSEGLLHIQLASAGLQESGASCIDMSNVLRGSNIIKQNLLCVAGQRHEPLEHLSCAASEAAASTEKTSSQELKCKYNKSSWGQLDISSGRCNTALAKS